MNLSNQNDLKQQIEQLSNASQNDQESISALLSLLQSNKDEIINWSILRSLGKIATGDQRTIQHLLEILQTGRPPSRVIASDVLQKIAQGNEPTIIFLTENIANSTDEAFAQAASVILEKIAVDSHLASETLINYIYNSTNLRIRELAIKILCQIDSGTKEGIDAILHLLKTGEGFTQRITEYLAVNAVGNVEVISCLKQMIRTAGDDPLISNARTFAARVLVEVNRDPTVLNPSYNRSRAGIEFTTTMEEYRSSINTDNIDDYLQLIKIGDNGDAGIAVYNLTNIGIGNDDVFAAFITLLDRSQDDYLRRLLIPGLRKITWEVSEETKHAGIIVITNQLKNCQNSFEKAQLAGTLGFLGGATQETVDTLEQMLIPEPSMIDQERIQNAAQAMREQGMPEEQIELALASMSSRLPQDHSSAIYNLGLIRGDVDGIGILLEKLKNSSNQEEIISILVAVRKNASDRPEVFAAFYDLLRSSIDPEIYGIAIYALVDMGGDSSEVVDTMNEIMAARSDYFETLLVRAGIYEQRRDVDKAMEDCETAISLNSEDINPWFLKGKIFFDRGGYADSIKANQHILQLQPENWGSHYNIACAYAKLNQLQSALEALEQALAIAPLEVKSSAVDDPDLESLASLPEFLNLIK